jgi:hypothetical protein
VRDLTCANIVGLWFVVSSFYGDTCLDGTVVGDALSNAGFPTWIRNGQYFLMVGRSLINGRASSPETLTCTLIRCEYKANNSSHAWREVHRGGTIVGRVPLHRLSRQRGCRPNADVD